VFADKYNDEFTVILGDWYHDEHDVLLKQFISIKNPGGAEPVPGESRVSNLVMFI
jgi:iron transport multicopper oxidase